MLEAGSPLLLALAVRHSALIVTPDYRMLPESSLDELMQDIEDFWNWVQTRLPECVRNQTDGVVEVDLSRIITSGESAGGFLSLITGLNHAEGVRSVMAAYPVVDVRSSYFTVDYEKSVFGMPQMPLDMIKEHMAKVKDGRLPSIVSSDPKGERTELMFAFIQRGAYRDSFPPDQRYNAILERLEDVARFPRGGVFVMHGKDDTVVPVGGSFMLQDYLRRLDPELNFHLAVRDGEHGFDGSATLDEDWLTDGLIDAVSSWLA
ncbi:unnamed protein product [Clonostachys rosea]|uniref:Alpha/beta hydrolase fold-3 domain-containing protein n=1 Tax=Bionectria ochroleuca TaxID=29856 RepID=A0ABY6UBY7_BIOOC|nr:unnamed protein product [Clonostachys rosea]